MFWLLVIRLKREGVRTVRIDGVLGMMVEVEAVRGVEERRELRARRSYMKRNRRESERIDLRYSWGQSGLVKIEDLSAAIVRGALLRSRKG